MIYLVTGQPGHGKTLLAVQTALQFVAKGREVYAHGVRGLKYGEAGFHELADAKKWQDCPDGSVFLIDECYTVFPKGGGTAKVPDYIEKLATHRHRGFDFILVCQQASKQLHPFIQGLVDQHQHVRRKFGFKKAIILSWDRYESNPRVSDNKKFWSYPSALMKRNLYESTVQDTTEKRIPWWAYALVAAVALVAYLVHNANGFWAGKGARPAAVAADGAKPAAGMFGGSGSTETKRPDDLVKWLTPRLPGQPWTAPAYDGRPVASEPEVYCMAVDDGRCGCITEQGTHYEMEVAMCRTVARNGVYNPTRRPSPDQRRMQPTGDAGKPVSAPVAAQAVQGEATAQGGLSGGHQRATATPYTPPTLGTWNPDPFGGASKR